MADSGQQWPLRDNAEREGKRAAVEASATTSGGERLLGTRLGRASRGDGLPAGREGGQCVLKIGWIVSHRSRLGRQEGGCRGRDLRGRRPRALADDLERGGVVGVEAQIDDRGLERVGG